MEKLAGTSLKDAVNQGVQKELSDLADELDRDADAKENMYRDMNMDLSAEREAWDLRNVARRLRKRVEAMGFRV